MTSLMTLGPATSAWVLPQDGVNQKAVEPGRLLERYIVARALEPDVFPVNVRARYLPLPGPLVT
jgi:hypothetical protein